MKKKQWLQGAAWGSAALLGLKVLLWMFSDWNQMLVSFQWTGVNLLLENGQWLYNHFAAGGHGGVFRRSAAADLEAENSGPETGQRQFAGVFDSRRPGHGAQFCLGTSVSHRRRLL